MKKTLSILLVFCMLLSMLPSFVLADEAAEDAAGDTAEELIPQDDIGWPDELPNLEDYLVEPAESAEEEVPTEPAEEELPEEPAEEEVPNEPAEEELPEESLDDISEPFNNVIYPYELPCEIELADEYTNLITFAPTISGHYYVYLYGDVDGDYDIVMVNGENTEYGAAAIGGLKYFASVYYLTAGNKYTFYAYTDAVNEAPDVDLCFGIEQCTLLSNMDQDGAYPAHLEKGTYTSYFLPINYTGMYSFDIASDTDVFVTQYNLLESVTSTTDRFILGGAATSHRFTPSQDSFLLFRISTAEESGSDVQVMAELVYHYNHDFEEIAKYDADCTHGARTVYACSCPYCDVSYENLDSAAEGHYFGYDNDGNLRCLNCEEEFDFQYVDFPTKSGESVTLNISVIPGRQQYFVGNVTAASGYYWFSDSDPNYTAYVDTYATPFGNKLFLSDDIGYYVGNNELRTFGLYAGELIVFTIDDSRQEYIQAHNLELSITYCVGHDYVGTEHDTTCTERGGMENFCLLCGFSYTDHSDYDYPSHDYQNGVCTRCGAYQWSSANACGEHACYTYADELLKVSGWGDMWTFTNWSEAKNAAAIEISGQISSVAGFQNFSSLEYASLGEVEKIGQFAFRNDINLETVDIGSSVTDICYGAFQNCYNLNMDLVLPEGLKTIDTRAFENCVSISSVSLPSTLESVSYESFVGMDGIPFSFAGTKAQWGALHVYLPWSVTCSDGVFNPTDVYSYSSGVYNGIAWKLNKYGTLTLKSAGNDIIENNNAFVNYIPLIKKVDVSSSIHGYCIGLFHGFDSLRTAELSSKAEIISGSMFMSCGSLVYVDVPYGVKTIEYNAFEGCSSLTEINVPGTVESIGSSAFAGCYNLGLSLYGDTLNLDSYLFGSYAKGARFVLFYGDCPATYKNAFGDVPTNAIIMPDAFGFSAKAKFAFGTNTSWHVLCDEHSLVADYNNIIMPVKGSDGHVFSVCSECGFCCYENIKDYVEIYNVGINGPTASIEYNEYSHNYDLAVVNGGTVSFSAMAFGAIDSYRWQYSKDNGAKWTSLSLTTYPTANTSTLEMQTTSSKEGMMLRCVVTGVNGTKFYTPDTFTLHVAPKVKITADPVSMIAGKNGKIEFHVAAEGIGLSYRWQYSKDEGNSWKSFSSTSNATVLTDTYEYTAKTTYDKWLYRCVVTDLAGNQAISDPAVFRYGSQLEITGSTGVIIDKTGTQLEYNVTAKGVELTYKWQYSKDQGLHWTSFNTEKNPSAATDTLELTSKATYDGWLFHCVVTDALNNKQTSEPGSYYVGNGAVIRDQSGDINEFVGNECYGRVYVMGEHSSRWQYSPDNGVTWKNFYVSTNPTANKDIFVFTADTKYDGWLIRCRVIAKTTGTEMYSEPVSITVWTK